MISDKKERPKVLAAAEEVQTISRSMLVWANTFPDKPVAIINYEFLDVDMAKPAEVGMTLSTIPGTYITSKYILGGYQAEYQFEALSNQTGRQHRCTIRSCRAVEQIRRLGQNE